MMKTAADWAIEHTSGRRDSSLALALDCLRDYEATQGEINEAVYDYADGWGLTALEIDAALLVYSGEHTPLYDLPQPFVRK